MKKIILWFINYMSVKKSTSGLLLFLALWSIGKFHPRSGSLLVLYRHLGKKMRNLLYFLNLKFLILIVWSNLPGLSMYKVPSIMPTNLHWSTGIKIRNSSVAKQSMDISLVLLARLVEICRLSI